jgi:hypothetical protein
MGTEVLQAHPHIIGTAQIQTARCVVAVNRRLRNVLMVMHTGDTVGLIGTRKESWDTSTLPGWCGEYSDGITSCTGL